MVRAHAHPAVRRFHSRRRSTTSLGKVTGPHVDPRGRFSRTYLAHNLSPTKLRLSVGLALDIATK
jgi:hypothetical protein